MVIDVQISVQHVFLAWNRNIYTDLNDNLPIVGEEAKWSMVM